MMSRKYWLDTRPAPMPVRRRHVEVGDWALVVLLAVAVPALLVWLSGGWS